MISWIISLVLLLGVLAAILWACGRLAHTWLYIEVPADLHWRAPCAAAGICLVGLIWPLVFDAVVGSRWPRNFDDLFLLDGLYHEKVRFREFIVQVPERGEVRYYPMTTARGGREWLDARIGGRPMPRNIEAIVGVVEDDAQTHVAFQRQTNSSVRWVSAETGWVMPEDEFGIIYEFSEAGLSRLVISLILLLGVWFAAFWVGLRLLPVHAAILTPPACLLWALTMNAWG